MNANSVPMFTSFASSSSGSRAAIAAITTPVVIVVRTGVPVRSVTVAKAGGSSRSRDIAKNTRLWPIIRIIITVVSPASAPIEMIVAIVGWPTDRNASASGALDRDLVVLHHAGDDERDGDVEHGADGQRAEDAARQVTLRVLRLLGRGRDDVEADEREEHQRGRREDAGDAERATGREPEVLQQRRVRRRRPWRPASPAGGMKGDQLLALMKNRPGDDHQQHDARP